MKALKLLFGLALVATIFTSCTTNPVYEEPAISLNQLLGSYDLWYVDINQTAGYGETPFLQIAFTLSFRNGVLFANNNLVGFGPNGQGNGLGIDVGEYDAYDMILDVYHDLDGFQSFDVYQVDYDTIELYNPFNDTSYFLHGYQKSAFDYDFVFYDNIHYFLQEYKAWEKTYTSQMGALNEFDSENYLQFLAGGNDSEFRSSQDYNISNPNDIYWDYTGIYGVGNITGNTHLKTLTLDYDYFDNEFFELSVLNDQVIELYHAKSGTTYEFTGRGYIQYMRNAQARGVENDGKLKSSELEKKRKQKTAKKDNPRVNKRD
ncbi:nicotinic acid mononucleotide adenyltransferase [Gelidibacter gilvus]|uniref:Nicotinic acid mononucleotide adenyltransferase n=1 Tax=Gelidibacter gilvus TaxID=59602 RepID=A0A4Q0XKJ6_9FLAO|nr:nicotinic acid mononucleotide adenyltransferase [Gelidibacter gilvus]RXJ52544.1 nicotinic acid mononucleotide adenyltransferase [Gelidibacter gilvus]